MSQYKIGTATFTNGSATVTGSGTSWLANVSAGNSIVRVGDNVAYEVSGVASDTSLTITAPYGGVTGSGLSYVAHIDFLPNGLPKFANGDVEFAAIQNQYNANWPSLPFGTAATVNTGLDPAEVPLNSDGSGIESLNADELSSGTVPNARLNLTTGPTNDTGILRAEDAYASGSRNYHSGNLNLVEFGVNSADDYIAYGGVGGSSFLFALPLNLLAAPSSITVTGTFNVTSADGATYTSGQTPTLVSRTSERLLVLSIPLSGSPTGNDVCILRADSSSSKITVNP